MLTKFCKYPVGWLLRDATTCLSNIRQCGVVQEGLVSRKLMMTQMTGV
jgi:hypothetical protein